MYVFFFFLMIAIILGSLRLAVLLIDPRREAQDLDLGMLQFLQREKLPFVIVATKCDKLV